MKSPYVDASPIGRRDFFRSFAGELLAGFDGIRGRPQERISDYFEAGSAELDATVPALRPGALIERSGTEVLVLRDGAQSFRLAPGGLDEAIVRGFDGKSTLAEAARRAAEVARRTADPNSALGDTSCPGALERARELFLELLDRGLCLSRRTLEELRKKPKDGGA